MTATGSSPAVARKPRLNVTYGSWELIWSHVQRILVVNVGLALACVPLLVALTTTHQPWRHPLLFAVLSLCAGPALAAAFSYLECSGDEEPASALALPRAYRRQAARALALWAPYTLLTAAAATDAFALRHTALGLAVVPALVVVAVLSANSGVLTMVHLAAQPSGAPLVLRDYLAAPYLLLRRWPLALMNLALLLVTAALVNQAPLLGLATLPGCALFVIWRNYHAMAGDCAAEALSGARSADGPGQPVRPGRT